MKYIIFLRRKTSCVNFAFLHFMPLRPDLDPESGSTDSNKYGSNRIRIHITGCNEQTGLFLGKKLSPSPYHRKIFSACRNVHISFLLIVIKGNLLPPSLFFFFFFSSKYQNISSYIPWTSLLMLPFQEITFMYNHKNLQNIVSVLFL